ncbi:MAG: hypothetical protein A2201_11835 [Alicyclobacillus sp. RIFOXYA1_FULL_53_8]|nr:MAG: hypothetical protein A2201_11835 [Alicyclobacillus sp. RIFOXYA1_FULL_53_8]
MSGRNYLELNEIIFIGRTFEEYLRMFNLSGKELEGSRILDCPGGACSFAAHASRFGGTVTAVDVVYGLPVSTLREKGLADLQVVRDGMSAASGTYDWTEFGHLDGLIETRNQAVADFLEDYDRNPCRYVQATLPNLPFADREFELVLSAHFLFTYAEQLDADFHLRTMNELLRVASREVRIFPLISSNGTSYPYLSELMQAMQGQGHDVEVVPVSYHFQRGANEMVRIQRKP